MNITYCCEKCMIVRTTFVPVGMPVQKCSKCGKIMLRMSFVQEVKIKGIK